MEVALVTDSLADIPEPLMHDLHISTVPALVRFGENVFRDRVDLRTDEFYDRLGMATTLPSTSQPPPSAFEEVYRSLAQVTDKILTITTASKLTGIYNSAVVGAENIPNATIKVIDSRQVTMALGWIVVSAARAARRGAGLNELEAIVLDAIPRAHIIAAVDTLDYAVRSGRLGQASALLGNLLNVKPIIALRDGAVVPVEKPRTTRRAIERLAQIVLSSGPIHELAVVHAAGLSLAQQLKQLLAQSWNGNEIWISETGPVLGTYVGPNAVGVAYLSAK